MPIRRFRLRWRRRFEKGQQQVEDLGTQAEKQIDEHLLTRFDRLRPVRRFVLSWLGLLILIIVVLVAQNIFLSGYYQTLKKVPGGIYKEGILGRFTNANPIYATSDADASVAKLIFAGLLNYDNHGKLVGDLASDYKVDEHGSTYTVHLRPNLKWQDGQNLTSEDVLFTYKLIQNPDVRSPLQGAWQGIDVSAPDKRTIIFKLPGILTAFPYSLTNGIVPKHVLAKVDASDMRSADFNSINPVGAGPFAWQNIVVTGDGNPKHVQEQLDLKPFKNYHAGPPKLLKFIVNIYADKDQLIEAADSNQLTGIMGLTDIPDKLNNNNHIYKQGLSLKAANMVFFKTSSGVLSDLTVRQALVRGANVPAIIKKLDYKPHIVREPILSDQVGYDRSLTQPAYDKAAAQSMLESAGWVVLTKDGLRSKANQSLTFTLTIADTNELKMVAKQLQKQWQAIGAKVNIQVLDSTDFQNALTYHNYEAILNGITIGFDSDVFVYWDSSQADIRSANRLNLSEYKNPTADAALEAGRTRLDPALRVIKYKPFLEAWRNDSPALALYQPRLLYLTNGMVDGLSKEPISSPVERLANVNNWQISEAKVTNNP